MKCAYNKSASIHIDVDGTLKVTLKAVEAGGNDAVVKDWHSVDALLVMVSSRSVSGAKPIAYTIADANHALLSIGGAEGVIPVGESQIVIAGRLGANVFSSTYLVQCDASGDNEVTDNLVLEVTCVPEDGGVETFGGKAGKITLGAGLKMTNKRLDLESELVIDLTDAEGVTDLATAMTAISGMSIHEAFGTSVEFTDVDALFYAGKGIAVIAGGIVYIFNRLYNTTTEGAEDYRYIYVDDTTTKHVIQVTSTGLATDNGIL